MTPKYPTYDDEVEMAYRDENREIPFDQRLTTCLRCSKRVSEDYTIDGRICNECAKEAGLAACDHCGRAVSVNILVAWEASRYCKPCVRELEKGGR